MKLSEQLTIRYETPVLKLIRKLAKQQGQTPVEWIREACSVRIVDQLGNLEE